MNAFGEERSEGARLLDAIRERWREIVLIVTVTVGIAAIYSMTAPKRYQASADILVNPVPDDPTYVGLRILRESGDPTRAVITAARFVKSEDVIRRVEDDLGTSVRNQLGSVQVKPLGQANIVTVEATMQNGSSAARLANAFADQTVKSRTAQLHTDLKTVIAQLEAQRRRLAAISPASRDPTQTIALTQRLAALEPLMSSDDPTLSVTNPATRPGSPSWPRPILSIVIAFIASALIALAAAVALELANPRISREEELVFGQRLPILARIPRLRGRTARDYLAGHTTLPAEVWESYRTLRANLATAGRGGKFPRTILVTSASPNEGKTMTAVNLAITLASGGLRVILVDADLRRPMIASVFGVSPASGGVRELFNRGATPSEIAIPAPNFDGDLRLVLASPNNDGGVDLLDARRVEAFLGALEHAADVVILDSPAVTDVADALSLADRVDSVLIVTRLGQTRRDRLNELRQALAQRGVVPSGLVVTTRERPRRYVHGYAQPRESTPTPTPSPQSLVDAWTGTKPGDV